MTRSNAMLPTSALTLLLPESCAERARPVAGLGRSRPGAPSSDGAGISGSGFGFFIAIWANSCTKQGLTSIMHERSYAGHTSLQSDHKTPPQRRFVSAAGGRLRWSGSHLRPSPASARARAGRVELG